MLSQNRSIRGARSFAPGWKREKKKEEEEVEQEREEAASANVTGLHSDVGVHSDCTGARLPPTCTHVQHTVDLGSAPTPTKPLAKRSLTSSSVRLPVPPRADSPPRRRTAEEHLRRRRRNDAAAPRRICTGIATHPHKGTGIASKSARAIECPERSYGDLSFRPSHGNLGLRDLIDLTNVAAVRVSHFLFPC